MMHGKSGETVNRGPVNRGITVATLLQEISTDTIKVRHYDSTHLNSTSFYLTKNVMKTKFLFCNFEIIIICHYVN